MLATVEEIRPSHSAHCAGDAAGGRSTREKRDVRSGGELPESRDSDTSAVNPPASA